MSAGATKRSLNSDNEILNKRTNDDYEKLKLI